MITCPRRLLFGGLFPLLFLYWSPLCGQDSIPPSGHFEVELEPAAFIFRGYTLNMGFQSGPFRVSVKSFAVNQPRLFVGNQHVAVQSSGIGFEVNYLFRPGRTPFVGALSDFYSDQLFARSTHGNGLQKSVSAGVRIGYRHLFGEMATDYRGCYLSGSLAAFRKLDAGDLVIAGEHYAPRSLYLIPAVNVGYRF
ncbi:hypothetical protein CLV84_1046 [Neolewinella xylanilytica]|uniref:DUF3575 domain-containing protein n=1 Tax=Neolewinella xylanilytica TaxID=1514080 RepID=A0A2S6I9B4_9BACT|nr:hypothetical protein [Neolewinella xylanilytica]PPK88083.1 hypothetical protein CLV84_1046 [Neolewinella xylanilytica]